MKIEDLLDALILNQETLGSQRFFFAAFQSIFSSIEHDLIFYSGGKFNDFFAYFRCDELEGCHVVKPILKSCADCT